LEPTDKLAGENSRWSYTATDVSTWNVAGGGSWSTASNWTSSVPDGAGQTASFGPSIRGPATITLDGDKTVGTLQFDSFANSYTITSGTGGSLVLDGGAGLAMLEAYSGFYTIASPVQLASNTEANMINAGNLVSGLAISGAITGTGSLTSSGSGILELTGTNSYTGPTTIKSGVIRIGNNAALSTGIVSFAGNGMLQAGANGLAPSNGILIGAGASAAVGVDLTLTLTGIISDLDGNGRLRKSGNGKLILTGANTYGGVTEIIGGVLSIATLPNGGAPSPIGQSTSLAANLVLNGGALEYTGPEATTDRAFTITSSGGALIASGSGSITFNSRAPVEFSESSSFRTITLSGTNTGANTLAAPIGNSTAGIVSLSKEGTGNWVLTSPNTFSGRTRISAGTLTLADPVALGGSLLEYDNYGGSLVFSEALSSATLGGLQGSQPLALENANGVPLSLTVGANGQDSFYSGILSGGGSLTKIGAGDLVLTGKSTYTGLTTVAGGTLLMFPGGGLAGTTSLAVNNSGTFRVASGNVAIAGPTSLGTGSKAGTVLVEGGTATFQQVILASDGSRFQVAGGIATLAGLTINRNSENGAFDNSGFIVTGGETTTGSIHLGTNNSWGTMQLMSGGNVTITGAFVVGNQATANRGGRLRVTGGFLNSIGAEGLVLGAQSNNIASAQFTGGTSMFQKICLISDDAVTGATATLTVNGGAVYLGSGGLVANTAGGSTATVLLSGGILGATGNWTAAVPAIELSNAAGGIVFQTADPSINPHNITIDSVLTGSGGLRKTGMGTLTLNGQNTYSGATLIEYGTVSAIGSLLATDSVTIGSGVLTLGANDRISNLASVTLENGILGANGFSETVGTLTVQGYPSIDLGTGASIIHFADSELSEWGGVLSITNWSGSPEGGGVDQLFFGDDATGLSSLQLGKIRFINPAGFTLGSYNARLLSNGELVVVPEPHSIMLLMSGIALVSCRRRRAPLGL
jgi:autotransporter-associated beta strand protein